jgi:hypothetical protein
MYTRLVRDNVKGGEVRYYVIVVDEELFDDPIDDIADEDLFIPF